MLVFENLNRNPMVIIADGIALITQLSIAKNGLNYPETLNDATIRTYKHISLIMNSNSNIEKQYFDVVEGPDRREHLIELSDKQVNEMGYSAAHSRVNIIKLLEAYNDDLVNNGKRPLIERHIQGGTSNLPEINELQHLLLALLKATVEIVKRDEKLKVETFESIFAEATQPITNKDIRFMLPELKNFLRKLLDENIAKGRISTVTKIKMKASMQLSDTFRGKTPTKDDILGQLKGFSLTKADKLEVVESFMEYKQG